MNEAAYSSNWDQFGHVSEAQIVEILTDSAASRQDSGLAIGSGVKIAHFQIDPARLIRMKSILPIKFVGGVEAELARVTDRRCQLRRGFSVSSITLKT
jgi:hypothetical protein